MAKQVKMNSPKKEKVTTTTKVERVLGSDIESSTYEQLSEKFDELNEKINSKKYPIQLTQDDISLLILDILPSIEWQGQQAWDIDEMQKMIVELKPDTEVEVSKESIKALLHFVANKKFVGTDKVYGVKSLLTSLATIIQEHIAKDEQLLRDAGFELQAAEQGILPEKVVENLYNS